MHFHGLVWGDIKESKYTKKIHQQTQKLTQETVNLVKGLHNDQQLRLIQKFNIHKIKNLAFHSSNSY